MLRLLYCIHSLNPAGGGTSDFVRLSATMQRSCNFSMEIACLDNGNEDWLSDYGAPVNALGGGKDGFGFSGRFVSWMRKNASRFDLVVVNGLWNFASVGTWLALRDSKTPYVVFPHGMLDPWFNDQYPLKKLKKQIYWLLGEYWVLKDARAVLFTSESEGARAKLSFSPYSAKGIVVPYGTLPPPDAPDVLRQEFLQEYPDLSKETTLLYLGRVHPKKGCDLLLKAFSRSLSRYPGLKLIVAGPCEAGYAREFEELLKLTPQVTRLPMVSGRQKWSLLAGADALVLPSHQENFGHVVTEALSCSTPVLISDKVNICQEVLGDGAGLTESDTLAGTEKLLGDFLLMSDEHRKEMRKNALSCFYRRFDRSTNFQAYLNILSDVASRSH